MGTEDISGFIGRFFGNFDIYISKRLFQILGFYDPDAIIIKTALGVFALLLGIFGIYWIFKNGNKAMIYLVLFAAGFVYLVMRQRKTRAAAVAIDLTPLYPKNPQTYTIYVPQGAFQAASAGNLMQALLHLEPQLAFQIGATPERIVWRVVDLRGTVRPHGCYLLSSHRTTTAVTMFEGGPKDNVLPQRARAVINFRVLPGDTTTQVAERVRRIIDDPQVELQPIAASRTEPTPVSSAASASFRALASTIRTVFPQVLAGPTLMLGQTDSRHFAAIADNTYRFMPVTLRADDLERIHGTDERIGLKAYAGAVRFYEQLVRSCDRER